MENDSRERDGVSSDEETGTDVFEGSGAGEVHRDDSASNSRYILRQSWLILSGLLLIASAVLLLLARTNAAFVVAALGVSAWFWNMRVSLKREHNIKSGRRAEQRSDDED